MRTSGNLALNPAYKPQYQPSKSNLKMKSAAGMPKKTAKTQKKANMTVALFYIAIIFALAIFLVAREAKLYENNSTIRQLEGQLEDAQTEAKQAMVTYEKTVDLGAVEETAVNEYKMSKPSANQIIYVSAEHGDYVEKTAKKDAGQNLTDTISGVFGIFGLD